MINSHFIKGGHSNEVSCIEQKDVLSVFSRLFTRQGKVFGDTIKIEIRSQMVGTQQRGRWIPFQLQISVRKEIERFLHEKHIEKVRTVNGKKFIQPTVNTVKKDKSGKIASNAGELNKAIVKDEYQMPNMDHLIDCGGTAGKTQRGSPVYIA